MANKKDEVKKKEIKKVDAKKETKKDDTKKVESKTKGKKIAKIEEVKSVPAKKERKNDSDKLLKFLEFMDKYRLAIYGVIGGVLATVLVVIIIWPDRIAKLKDGTEPVAEIDGMILTADELYEDMKEIYSISALLDKIDNKILEEKYPETEEMNDELQSEAENYYNVYNQYQGTSKEEFLSLIEEVISTV